MILGVHCKAAGCCWGRVLSQLHTQIRQTHTEDTKTSEYLCMQPLQESHTHITHTYKTKQHNTTQHTHCTHTPLWLSAALSSGPIRFLQCRVHTLHNKSPQWAEKQLQQQHLYETESVLSSEDELRTTTWHQNVTFHFRNSSLCSASEQQDSGYRTLHEAKFWPQTWVKMIQPQSMMLISRLNTHRAEGAQSWSKVSSLSLNSSSSLFIQSRKQLRHWQCDHRRKQEQWSPTCSLELQHNNNTTPGLSTVFNGSWGCVSVSVSCCRLQPVWTPSGREEAHTTHGPDQTEQLERSCFTLTSVQRVCVGRFSSSWWAAETSQVSVCLLIHCEDFKCCNVK